MSRENVEIVRGVRHRITLPDERAARRRSLDERLFVRLPALYHLIAAVLTRLPPRSRIRRLILTRYVRRGYAAINRRDFEVLFLGLDPDIEYTAAGDVLPPGMFPPVSHGHAGYEGNWRQLIDSFEDFRVEPEEILDMGETLIACNRYVGHGSGSGVPVDVPLVFQVARLRNGLVFWQKDFSDRAEALEAARLSE
jgi:ketosteroid isomerase-like protein